jgi:hypothetical protein
MKYDGWAFPAPDIREIEHGDMPCKPRSSSVTTSGNMVNDPVDTVDVSESSTPDTSFAAFLIEPEPGE